MKTWVDQGGGKWKLTVTSDNPGDGAPISVFHGTREEIADQLADSQANANRRIAELKRNGQPQPPPPPPTGPKPLTAAERMQTVADLTNPATADKAVLRIVESAVGPIENLREAGANAPAEREDRQERRAVEAAEAFAAETPEYYPSPHNAGVMYRYVQLHGDLSNKAHYQRAFQELSEAQLLQTRPREDTPETQPSEPQPERNAPAPALPKAPTRISTGVTSRDVSGTQPRPTNRLKYTREQIANMSARTYKDLMRTDPELTRCVEYYAKQPQRRVG